MWLAIVFAVVLKILRLICADKLYSTGLWGENWSKDEQRKFIDTQEELRSGCTNFLTCVNLRFCRTLYYCCWSDVNLYIHFKIYWCFYICALTNCSGKRMEMTSYFFVGMETYFIFSSVDIFFQLYLNHKNINVKGWTVNIVLAEFLWWNIAKKLQYHRLLFLTFPIIRSGIVVDILQNWLKMC